MITVSLVFSPAARELHERMVTLPTGATVLDALKASGWLEQWPQLQSLTVSVWGRRVLSDTVLGEGDRVEWCRSLRVDPKVARRERFAGQGARGAGLFSRRRPGSKAGY